MAIDKVLLEVLNNRFTGIVEEMGYVIHRASFTVFVKETWDFDSALVTTGGEIFCYPRNIGVTNMLGMSMAAAIESIPHYEPGDIVCGAASFGGALDWQAKAEGPTRTLSFPLEAWFELMDEHFDLVRAAMGALALRREALLDHLAAQTNGIVLT